MAVMTRFEDLRVADAMTIDPVVVKADASLEEAEELLHSYRVTGLPVVNGIGQLIGVISQSDLVGDGNAWLSSLLRGNSRTLRVGELMTVPALTVPLTSTLKDAARLMRDEGVHRLVVTDDAEHPIGVLSASDFVYLIADA